MAETLIWILGIGTVLILALLFYIRVYPNFMQPTLTTHLKAPTRRIGYDILKDDDFGILGEIKDRIDRGFDKITLLVNIGGRIIARDYFKSQLKIDAEPDTICTGSPLIYRVERTNGEQKNETADLAQRYNQLQRELADERANRYELLDDAQARVKELIAERSRGHRETTTAR